jgi:hypothetical protein
VLITNTLLYPLVVIQNLFPIILFSFNIFSHFI